MDSNALKAIVELALKKAMEKTGKPELHPETQEAAKPMILEWMQNQKTA